MASARFLATCRIQASQGWRVIPATCTRRVFSSMRKNTE